MRHTPPPPVDIAVIIPELAPMARTTVRLHPRQGVCAADQSKVGGLFLWPGEEPWPLCQQHNSPFVTVLQLRAEDVLEMTFPPGKDLFQLLWCPNDHDNGPPYYAPAPRVFWRSRAAIQDSGLEPPAPVVMGRYSDRLPDYIPHPCVLHLERVTEYPDVFDIVDNFPELLEKMDASSESLRNDFKQQPNCEEKGGFCKGSATRSKSI